MKKIIFTLVSIALIAESNRAQASNQEMIHPIPLSPEMQSAISSMLVFENPHIIVDWTPKAGCTALFYSLFKNYNLFHHVVSEMQYGEIEQQAIHHASNKFFKRCSSNVFFNPKYYKIKLVRNPYKRAVSCYLYLISLLSLNLSFEDFLTFIKNKNWEIFPIPNGKNDYRSHLKRHVQIQWKPTDNYMDAIIHLEEPNELKKVNDYTGLQLNLDYQASHHAPYFRKKPYYVGDLIINKEENYPPFYAFYSPQTLALVEEIYKKDIESYGYSCPEEIAYFIKHNLNNERPLSNLDTWSPSMWKRNQ